MTARMQPSPLVERMQSELNLADQAHARLTRLILQRQLPGGTMVVEARLAEQLQISRTPMREAMLRLAAERLLVKHGSRSFAVRTVTPAEFFQSMKVRELLELEAVAGAAGKVPAARIVAMQREIAHLATARTQERAHWDADDRFHQLFADASGNEVLARMIREARVSTRLFEISRPFLRVQADGAEHLAVLAAFAADDIKGARRAMQKHIRNLIDEAIVTLAGG
jgi:DNA-binding GntR family transcriptional regulator